MKILYLLFTSTLVFSFNSNALTSCAQLFGDTKTAFTFNSKIVKGIIELRDKAEISQSIYDEFNVNEIARGIVERVKRQEAEYDTELVKVGIHKPVDLENKAEIILFFKNTDLNSIKEKGFLNQHEAGKSNGTYNKHWRFRAEDNVTGVQLGTSLQAMKLRPKSAFLNIHEDIDLTRKSHPIVGKYGNIGAVLKQEIKNRSIWVAADSLGLGLGGHYYDINIDFTGKSLVPFRGTFSRKSIACVAACTSFNEALIYGKIDFTDVDYFFVTDRSLADALKSAGKPIYLIKQIQVHNRVVFEKGELIYAGEFISEGAEL